MAKKLNFFSKFLLKLNRPGAYYEYRIAQEYEEKLARLMRLYPHPLPPDPSRRMTTFRHSGNAGDIIYALPTIQALAAGSPATLLLRLNVPTENKLHPLGGVMLNEDMAEKLFPLLRTQPYLHQVLTDQQQAVDYDLDLFREAPLLLDRGDIARWYFHIFNVFPDLSQPWLYVKPDTQYKDHIILARSERYNSPSLHYDFLRQYPNILFLGVEQEFRRMKEQVPQIQWLKVQDFLQMARVIAGGRFFIGNQSFPYAIAEALKVHRILEVCHITPNVIPHDPRGRDVYFQPQFERSVADFFQLTS